MGLIKYIVRQIYVLDYKGAILGGFAHFCKALQELLNSRKVVEVPHGNALKRRFYVKLNGKTASK